MPRFDSEVQALARGLRDELLEDVQNKDDPRYLALVSESQADDVAVLAPPGFDFVPADRLSFPIPPLPSFPSLPIADHTFHPAPIDVKPWVTRPLLFGSGAMPVDHDHDHFTSIGIHRDGDYSPLVWFVVDSATPNHGDIELAELPEFPLPHQDHWDVKVTYKPELPPQPRGSKSRRKRA